MRRLLVGLAIASIVALSPGWVHADDQQIAQRIVKQLRQQKADGTLTGFGIDLEVESGIVWLKGHVASREQQTQVLDIARHVKGVEQVVNDLHVKSAETTSRKKKMLIRPALLRQPGQLLTSLNRGVKRAFHKDTRDDSSASEEIGPSLAKASTVSQTKRTERDDSAIAGEIISKLRAKKTSGELRNFDVDVQVNNRVVWVSGRIASKQQQTLVLDVARRIRGVKQVVNDLHVGHATPVRVASVPLAPATGRPTPALAPVSAPAQLQRMPARASQVPLAFAPAQSAAYSQQVAGQPMPAVPAARGIARARFDHPSMPGHAWPSYAAYPNYAAVTYPRQYSPTAWPYIGPFYPYPQVPLGWRKVTLEWDDGWWMLNFKSK